jgi:CO/xanthine dehydrogenase FAD-binding subunit
LEEVLVPPPSGKTVYLKWRLRDALEFPLIGLVLHLETGTGGKIQQAKVIFTGVGPGPVETLETEKMLMGGLLDAGLIEKVSSHVGNELSPMRTSMVSPAYKRQMAGILLKQALDQMC